MLAAVCVCVCVWSVATFFRRSIGVSACRSYTKVPRRFGTEGSRETAPVSEIVISR